MNKLFLIIGILLLLTGCKTIKKENTMEKNYQIVEITEKKLAGISIRTSNEDHKSIKDMQTLWGRFFAEGVMQRVGETVDYNSYGLYYDYEDDFSKPYDYMAAMEVVDVNSASEGVEIKTIPGGKYAKFSATGNIMEVVGTLWNQVWKSGLDRTYEYDFEMYHYTKDEDNQLIEIYIGIK